MPVTIHLSPKPNPYLLKVQIPGIKPPEENGVSPVLQLLAIQLWQQSTLGHGIQWGDFLAGLDAAYMMGGSKLASYVDGPVSEYELPDGPFDALLDAAGFTKIKPEKHECALCNPVTQALYDAVMAFMVMFENTPGLDIVGGHEKQVTMLKTKYEHMKDVMGLLKPIYDTHFESTAAAPEKPSEKTQ